MRTSLSPRLISNRNRKEVPAALSGSVQPPDAFAVIFRLGVAARSQRGARHSYRALLGFDRLGTALSVSGTMPSNSPAPPTSSSSRSRRTVVVLKSRPIVAARQKQPYVLHLAFRGTGCHSRFRRRPSLGAVGSQTRGADGKSPLVGTFTRPVHTR